MSEAELLLVPLYAIQYQDTVREALAEDLGRAGDLTTDAIVREDARATALLLARAPGRIAGLQLAAEAFRCLDGGVQIEMSARDGLDAPPGGILATIRGSARAVLSAERTALNFLGRLSGIATVTRDVVRAVSPHRCRVVCTRKTTPLLRTLEKYAVRAGGGANHRFGLDDGVLIKDNHRAMAGSITEAVSRARRYAGHMVKIEIEVDTLEQLGEALQLPVDAVLLDNMPPAVLREAVRMAQGRVITEASGGITPQNAAEIAATGVDLISIGWLTHSASSLDLSLDVSLSP